jgi:hypothetical protein
MPSVDALAIKPDTAERVWFSIAGGAPNARVSWQVVARRADRYVRAYGAPTELAKEGPELGTFLAPELWGAPEATRTTGALVPRRREVPVTPNVPSVQGEGVAPVELPRAHCCGAGEHRPRRVVAVSLDTGPEALGRSGLFAPNISLTSTLIFAMQSHRSDQASGSL